MGFMPFLQSFPNLDVDSSMNKENEGAFDMSEKNEEEIDGAITSVISCVAFVRCSLMSFTTLPLLELATIISDMSNRLNRRIAGHVCRQL
ncbi:hypothetical protein FQA39_LY14927 [Lamprigera yunnana]|nr:hypothetical protein FQA39_LY14927 [Lamprigera yunnana]